MDKLLEEIENKNYSQRWFASEILGTKRNLSQKQINKMKKLITNPEIGEVISWGLGQMGIKGLEKELSKGLYHDDIYVKWRSAEALRDIGSKEAVKLLSSGLSDCEDIDTRWRCAWALGEIKNPLSFDVLWNSIKDKSKYVRWESTKALVNLGSSIKHKIYKKLESTNDNYLIWRGIWILGKIGSKDDIEKLKCMYKNKDNKYIQWQINKVMEALTNERN